MLSPKESNRNIFTFSINNVLSFGEKKEQGMETISKKKLLRKNLSKSMTKK